MLTPRLFRLYHILTKVPERHLSLITNLGRKVPHLAGLLKTVTQDMSKFMKFRILGIPVQFPAHSPIVLPVANRAVVGILEPK